MAYSYVKPAMYDHTIDRDVIRVLKLCPLLYCAMGWLFYSSSGVFLEQDADFNEKFSVNQADWLK